MPNVITTLISAGLLLFASHLSAHPFLWKATGEHTFYLFGTIHLPDPRVTELPAEVLFALESSTSFYAELDLSESNLMEIADFTRLQEEQSLSDVLPQELINKLDALLKKMHPTLNTSTFNSLKVWVMAISLMIIEQQQKFPLQPPLDLALYERATALGMNTGGVETNEEQFQIFDDLSQDEQIILLNDTIDYIQNAKAANKDVIEESIQAYLAGDLDKLSEQLLAHMQGEPFYENLLTRIIDDRNNEMTQTIQMLVEEHPDEIFFFAIGAGHFAGQSGIKTRLEKVGYSIDLID
jgi:uncharacterized protein YbaP (TraB family)